MVPTSPPSLPTLSYAASDCGGMELGEQTGAKNRAQHGRTALLAQGALALGEGPHTGQPLAAPSPVFPPPRDQDHQPGSGV